MLSRTSRLPAARSSASEVEAATLSKSRPKVTEKPLAIPSSPPIIGRPGANASKMTGT